MLLIFKYTVLISHLNLNNTSNNFFSWRHVRMSEFSSLNALPNMQKKQHCFKSICFAIGSPVSLLLLSLLICKPLHTFSFNSKEMQLSQKCTHYRLYNIIYTYTNTIYMGIDIDRHGTMAKCVCKGRAV